MAESTKGKGKIILKTAQRGTEFVGLKITDSDKTITFPMCYNLSEKTITSNKLNKSQRISIINLLTTINGCRKLKEGEKIIEFNEKKTSSELPLKAIIFIIEDFLNRNTYYTEKEILYTNGNRGKISWNRTIKNVKPNYSEKGIAFLDFIVLKNHIQENQLITELHKYCVFKCFEILGFLYTSFLPDKGLLTESDVLKNKKYYLSFIQDKIDNTYLEVNIELFSAMSDFINNFNADSELCSATFGTKSFQTVWETMIEKVFATITEREKDSFFYPRTKWTSKHSPNVPLRPDTIMIGDGKCFILDSKYYSFNREKEDESENGDETRGSIPGSDSIQKQITYAEFIDKGIANNNENKRSEKYRFDANNIFSVFILPSKNSEEKFEYIGYATSEWKDNTKNYHFIHAVGLDTQFLMINGNKNAEDLRKELMNILYKNKVSV